MRKKGNNYCENEENKCYTKLPKRPMMICHKAIHYVSVLMEKKRVCFQRARAARAPPRSRSIWARVE